MAGGTGARRRSRRRVTAAGAIAVLALVVLPVAGCGSGSTTADPGSPAATDPVPAPAPAPGDDDLIVFVQPSDLTRVASVQASLLANPSVRGLSYVSQADALQEFTCMFAAEPQVVAGVTADILPPSFRVDAGTDPVAIANLANQARALPGVKEVVSLAEGVGTGGSGAPGSTQVSALDPACAQHGTRLR